MNALTIRIVQTDILVAFVNFCNENNLYYTLDSGTLLGAIRHKGFIPWDDDIDVAMPRPDYEKFIELSKKKQISPNMEVLSYKLGNSTYPFIKIIDNRTEVEEKFVSNTKIGVWIDVFPLDGKFENKFFNSIHYFSARTIRKMIEIKRNDFGSGTTIIKQILKSLMYPFTKIFSFEFLCILIDKVCCIKAYSKSNYIGDVMWGCYKNRMQRKNYEKSINAEFEGYFFKIPSNYDEYMKNVYGDYMQLPSEEERICHDFKAWRKE